ncbi:hypothetical protein PDESU_06229 [Pontiella desulfatans]|uniref:DUF2062 domain-containing protein n=1 Tax=Pontiella desulfatans TaxID=2750659 RepID=A0A6C2UBU0_PONDE|nr:DUF2062 domain-containing protein [Pontiella desulfatans]VGO17628.1 hypothetical protein PDESU_06229 [Pontiella desulfatans]
MITFKLVRKIGKMLRGGAGKKEIFLGALLGVLIGFNPVAGLTLSFAILITLLLNANIGFTLLGVALGKVCSLILSVASFHMGYFLIHNLGLEGLFAKLVNAPVTALMDLDVYAMVGSLPFSIVIGIAFGAFMSATVTKIREQMVKAGGHEKVGKAVGNKFSKFLMWLAFGKQKISTADVLAKQSPLLRKSGLILVGSVVVIGLVLQFFLLDLALKKGIQASIGAKTGAEVNIDKANFSLAGGKLEIENLQITDPDKPTHNMIQIGTLAADVSVGDLLRRTYTIDLLSGSMLKRDVLRESPGKLIVKEEKKKKEEKPKDEKDPGKSLDDYFAKAKEWKKYGEKAEEYLKKRKENAEQTAKGEKPKPSKEKAVADARKLGYLKAAADLVANRPAWTIRQIMIDNVELGSDFPIQKLEGAEVSSHPELNGQATTFVMTPQNGTDPTAKIVLRFDDPAAMHELAANIKNVEIGDSLDAGDALEVKGGKADIQADGSFSLDELAIPFTLNVRDLETDNAALNAMDKLEVTGSLYGSLSSPRVKVELGDLKDAAIDAAKARANEEVEKAKQKAAEEVEKAKAEAKKKADAEINKALESDEAKDLKDKFRKMF